MRLTSKTEAAVINCTDNQVQNCKVFDTNAGVPVSMRFFDIAPTEAKINLLSESALYFRLLCEMNTEGGPTQGVAFCSISPERRVLFDQILSTFKFIQ